MTSDTTRANGLTTAALRLTRYSAYIEPSNFTPRIRVDEHGALCLFSGVEAALASRDERIASLEAEVSTLRGDLNIANLHKNAKLCSECPRNGELAALRSQVERLEGEHHEQHEWLDALNKALNESNVRLIAERDSLRAALAELVRFLEPLERDGGLNVPGLATLNRYRWLISPPPSPLGYQPEAASPALVVPPTKEPCGACGGSGRLDFGSMGEDCPYCAQPEQASGAGRVFEFDRYRDGRKMAEGVQISRASTEEEARRLARNLYHSDEEMGELRLRPDCTSGAGTGDV